MAKITHALSITLCLVCSDAQTAFASAKTALTTSMSCIYSPYTSGCQAATASMFYKVPVTSTGKWNLVARMPAKPYPN